MPETWRRMERLHADGLTRTLGVCNVTLPQLSALVEGAPAALVAVLVLVKTILDLRGHWPEHDHGGESADAPSPT